MVSYIFFVGILLLGMSGLNLYVVRACVCARIILHHRIQSVDHSKAISLSLFSSEEIPDETVALSLAAPAIAVANIASQQPITHTAPLLPTPPSLLSMASGIGTSVLGTPPVAAAAALTAAMPGLAGVAPAMVRLGGNWCSCIDVCSQLLALYV